MNNHFTDLENGEGEILTSAVSDEALELASGTTRGQANFTLAACTGLSSCPA
jgi:hypothetical protein